MAARILHISNLTVNVAQSSVPTLRQGRRRLCPTNQKRGTHFKLVLLPSVRPRMAGAEDELLKVIGEPLFVFGARQLFPSFRELHRFSR